MKYNSKIYWIKKIKKLKFNKTITTLAIYSFYKILNNNIYFILSKNKKYYKIHKYDNLLFLYKMLNKYFNFKEIIFIQLINIDLNIYKKNIINDANIKILCNLFNIDINKILININKY